MNIAYDTLQRIANASVLPDNWIAIQQDDRTYTLTAYYKNGERVQHEFVTIITAREQVKYYKTLEALMNDVRKIELAPMIEFKLKE